MVTASSCETHCALAILAHNLASDCEFVNSSEVTHWKLIIRHA